MSNNKAKKHAYAKTPSNVVSKGPKVSNITMVQIYLKMFDSKTMLDKYHAYKLARILMRRETPYRRMCRG